MWKAKLEDKSIIYESSEISWKEIKNKVIELSFITKDGKEINLPPFMPEYIQAKTASADMNGDNIQIESRYIGFVYGNNTYIIRIDEKTGNITVEI